MRSLFEEQIDAESAALIHLTSRRRPRATPRRPRISRLRGIPADARPLPAADRAAQEAALTIPVIASLNGCRPGGWTDYAAPLRGRRRRRHRAQPLPARHRPESGRRARSRPTCSRPCSLVTATVKIPVAVKLSPFHTSPAQFALALEEAGAAGRGAVQPLLPARPGHRGTGGAAAAEAVRPERAAAAPALAGHHLAAPAGSLASTGGAHSSEDVIKAILAGAHTVQLVSVLLKHGPATSSTILHGLKGWMEEHGYETIEEFRGAMNLKRCPDPRPSSARTTCASCRAGGSRERRLRARRLRPGPGQTLGVVDSTYCAYVPDRVDMAQAAHPYVPCSVARGNLWQPRKRPGRIP
jgi:dihydroorotate dehydrogenase (fumarate)